MSQIASGRMAIWTVRLAALPGPPSGPPAVVAGWADGPGVRTVLWAEGPGALADAIAASCASGSPHGIGDNRYIDGGYRRNENADLAAGYERVLVLSPFGGRTRTPLEWGMQLTAQVDELRARGSRVETIFPDSNSEHMFGANAMDLSLRPPAARAGYNQGRALAEQLTEFWR